MTYFKENFLNRHITTSEESALLQEIGLSSVEQLLEQTIPKAIRLPKKLNLPDPLSEFEFSKKIKKIGKKNKLFRSFIGMGYHGTITPAVIQRNVLENPAWYTAYTPYQAEIAQGRLEALLNFQTLITDLTGMEVANASLLDEATAAAEAMNMLFATREHDYQRTFFVSHQCHPQIIAVVQTRAEPLGILVEVGDFQKIKYSETYFAVLFSYPTTEGFVLNYEKEVQKAHENNIKVAFCADLLALTILTPPGEWGADVVVGSTQRFGVPMGYGGPHAAFFATKESYKRYLPGRIIGLSIDAQGNPALRMALQTREQHIRREKATSNICTSQVLLAVMASFYAIYHGKNGLQTIAKTIYTLVSDLAYSLEKNGISIEKYPFFDTIKVKLPISVQDFRQKAEEKELNFRYFTNFPFEERQEEKIEFPSLLERFQETKNSPTPAIAPEKLPVLDIQETKNSLLEGENFISISLDETTTEDDIRNILSLFGISKIEHSTQKIESKYLRKTDFLTHPTFHLYQSEHELLRYIKRLETKDLSLVHSMISLGSCTMKLNATTEMLPITQPEFCDIHPFVPSSQVKGYQELIQELGEALCEITGFSAISFQPNSGAQGEYAGLLVIREFHKNNNQKHRNIALIPASAHGTNPASAVLAGMQVVVVKCDDKGNIDVLDLKEKAEKHSEYLSCLMITYPSTHGVFEERIQEICELIHQYGGQVYMDGANMNAQVGLTSPGFIGADVCHLNLHKTFCIPHGGGGPGMGPIGVASHLAAFLPTHFTTQKEALSVSAAPFGSAGILPISYAYIQMMGSDGLTEATKRAILNANYCKKQLENHYPILYTNAHGRVAHELIIDCRGFKISANIEAEDIAKRLMDYGFHSPTLSFPVAGTLMIEPTESEAKAELDRFCDALISIRVEIQEIESGQSDKQENVLKNAPHTAEVLISDHWKYPYSRQKAAYPLEYLRKNKFWVSVGRVNNAYGDRNLICTCPPVESYE